MPKARTKNNPPPDGWELIESTLNDFDHRMRDAEMESDLGKRKVETVWPIFRIHHQRSRYIYEMYSQRKEVRIGNLREDRISIDGWIQRILTHYYTL
jgi:bud site selection protein 31